jgi:hypothetical protein
MVQVSPWVSSGCCTDPHTCWGGGHLSSPTPAAHDVGLFVKQNPGTDCAVGWVTPPRVCVPHTPSTHAAPRPAARVQRHRGGRLCACLLLCSLFCDSTTLPSPLLHTAPLGTSRADQRRVTWRKGLLGNQTPTTPEHHQPKTPFQACKD